MINLDGEVVVLLEDANAPFPVWGEEKFSRLTPKNSVKEASEEGTHTG